MSRSNLYDLYISVTTFCEFYIIGFARGAKREGWRVYVACFVMGLLWPAMMAYGIYLTHFRTEKRK